MELQAPSNNPFQVIGDKVRGRFVSFEELEGKFEKSNFVLTLKTASGELAFNCPTDLRAKIAHNLTLLKQIKPVLVIVYTADKHVGQPKPMKVFKVDVDDKAPAAPAKPEAPTTVDDDGADAEEIPF